MGGKQYAIGPARMVNGKRYPSFEKEAESLLSDYGCLHFKFSILLGVSRPAYSEEQLAQFKAEDNRKFEFEGKKYSQYEASQLQKRIESEVRRQKDRATIAKAAGDDEMRREAQYKINLLTNKYAKLTKESGLPTKMERLKYATKPLTNGGSGGIMKKNRVYYTKADPMREVFGSAFDSHKKEVDEIIRNLESKGVKVIFRDGVMSYQPNPISGKPGQMVIDKQASYSAFKHEERHALDDESSGWLGYRNFMNIETAIRFEIDAYDVEIQIAREYGLTDMVDRLQKLKESRRRELLGE